MTTYANFNGFNVFIRTDISFEVICDIISANALKIYDKNDTLIWFSLPKIDKHLYAISHKHPSLAFRGKLSWGDKNSDFNVDKNDLLMANNWLSKLITGYDSGVVTKLGNLI